MITKLYKIFLHPKMIPAYWAYFKLSLFKKISSYFINKPFILQGQMDIHPRSYWGNKNFVLNTGGFFIPNDNVKRTISDFEPWDFVRRDMIILLLRTIIVNKVEGDLVELGVYKGLTAKLLHHYMPDRMLHLFDTFEGFNKNDISIEHNSTGLNVSTSDFSDVTLSQVKKYINPINSNVMFYKGYFPNTATDDIKKRKFAFVHLDADLYSPTKQGLEFFYSKMSKGGIILVHDYNTWPGARRAVDEFCNEQKVYSIPLPDKSGSAMIMAPT